jgi:hypothetical protein
MSRLLSRAARVRTAPATSVDTSTLSECLLVPGSGGDEGDAGGDGHEMFDGMVVMRELPMECENPNAVSEGGGEASAWSQTALGGSASDSSGGGSEKSWFKKKASKGGTQQQPRAAPKAQEFPPELLQGLGFRTNSTTGELEEADVEVPPGVTEEAIAKCTEMGFNKALAVRWLAATDNSTGRALEHLLAGETPPTEAERRAAAAAASASPAGGAAQQQLPPGWEARTAPDGRPFYLDHRTQTTHWQLPVVGPRMVTMEITVPPGACAGQILTVSTPNGQQVSMAVPQGARPGMKIRFRVGAAAMEESQARPTCRLEVVVPPQARVGQAIQVRAPNGQIMPVQVPVGATPGQRIRFDVDASYGKEPPMLTMQVVLPAHCRPGQVLRVAKPNGQPVSVQVPANAVPGSTLQFRVPA